MVYVVDIKEGIVHFPAKLFFMPLHPVGHKRKCFALKSKKYKGIL
jgi:hypothetical protein